MKITIVFSLLLIVIDAGCGDDGFVKRAKINPSAVNLAVETALIFDAEDTRKDMSLIDNIQNFLAKLKGYLRMREQARFRAEDEKEGIFTAFLKDFSRIIVNYDNDSLKNLTDIVALTMEPYYYKGTAFHKLIKGREFKSYIQDKIMDWADTDPKMLKYKMALAIATAAKENTPLTQFGHYLNKFFTEKDSKKLKKLLRKFNNHEMNDTQKLVKRAIEFIIFRRYNKLDDAAKLDLSYAIKNVSAFVMHNYPTPKFNHTISSLHNETDNHSAKVKDAKTNEHNDTVKHSEKHKDKKTHDHKKTHKHSAKHKHSKTKDKTETVKLKDSRRFNKARRAREGRAKVNPLLPKQIVLNKDIQFKINTKTEENKYTVAINADEGINSTEVPNEVSSTNNTKHENLDEVDTIIVASEEAEEAKKKKQKKQKKENKKLERSSTNNTKHENLDEVDTIIVASEEAEEAKKKKKEKKKKQKKKKQKKENKKVERTHDSNETVDEVKVERNNTQIDVYKQIMAIRIGSENLTEIDMEHNIEHANKNNNNTDEKVRKQPKVRALAETTEKEPFFTKGLDENELNEDTTGNDARKMGVYFHAGEDPTFYTVTKDVGSDTNERGMLIDKDPHTTAAYNYDADEHSVEEDVKTTKVVDVIESDNEEYQHKVHEGANKIRDLLDTVVAQKLMEKSIEIN